MSDSDFAINNQLLSALYVSTYQRLLPHLELISLTSGQVIHRSYETITEVYFPQSAIFSLVLQMSERYTTEVALVGNQGMVGLAAVLGLCNVCIYNNKLVLKFKYLGNVCICDLKC